jgi:Leucine-rich repeat (LRR) protein/GTPase SAR1 family protein
MEREELLRLIDRAADEQWTELDLAGMDLTELPPEIGKLTQLETLVLGKFDYDKMKFIGNQLTDLSPDIEKLTSLTNLALSSNQIAEIPESIGKLTNLTNLDLSDNQIAEIPESIGKLTNLTNLELISNQIAEIPESIANLTNLTNLDLSSNQIAEIPESIANLTNLTNLALWSNQIAVIPEAIANLTNLTNLDLSRNQIAVIPEAIANLTNLTNLALWSNQIAVIPEAIANLTNLTNLAIGGNQIAVIPEAIANLTNLTNLDLSRNQIAVIPEAIANLTNLTNLDLGGNQIAVIPEAIAKLTNLTNLALGRNQITEIPIAIGKLTSLTNLSLWDNQIAEIPQWFQSFENLRKLDLRGNPIPIPREILGGKEIWGDPGDIQAILSFYFQTQDPSATEPLYEAKFIIVGEGGAGKTTLAKKLKNADYKIDPDESKTHGINIIRWEFEQSNGKPFRVNIWDFGGQEILHATHQFFLTERSLYTLLVDERRENPNLYYWLNIVRLLSENSPVFIIKNEKQDCECPFNEGQLRAEFDNLQNSVRTNLATNRGLDDIQKAIATHLSTLPDIHQPIPKTWLRIRDILENYSQHQNYISVDEYYALCKKTTGLKDKQEMLCISKYLHELGICLHFQKDLGLKSWVILNPTWATNAVYRVTETDKVKKNNGCFTRIDLETIWNDNEYAQMHDELLQLMQKFGICYLIRNLTDDTYIVPSLLSIAQPDYPWNETDNLILRYKYEFMPRGIITRFIVEIHNLIESCPAPAPPTSQLVWKNGVILTDSHARAEVIEYYEQKEIRIRVVGFQKKTLLEHIRREFHKIHDSYDRLKYEELIPCNCAICKNTQTPYTYTLKSLLKRLENRRLTVECDVSYESINVRQLIDEVIEPMREDSGLTPSQQKRLEQEGDSLQSALDLRSEKLARLRKESAIATDTSIKFKLEKEIDDEEDNIQKLIDRLEEIEQQLNNKSSFGKARSIRAKPRTPDDSPSASIVNHTYINKIENNMTGNTNTFGGDYVRGNKIEGDYVAGDKIGTQINNAQNLAQAAVEIQELLDNLAELYNPNSETGQAKIAKEAIESIEQNPTLKGRIINAIKEGSYTAIEAAVDRPAVKILMAAFKGFSEGK